MTFTYLMLFLVIIFTWILVLCVTAISNKSKKEKTITSIDGYNSYLIIVDRSTRYTWIFLQSSKEPPINAIKILLTKFKTTQPHRTVRIDQGGELGGYAAFKELLAGDDMGFSLELTGVDAPAQNGRCENPNRVYG